MIPTPASLAHLLAPRILATRNAVRRGQAKPFLLAGFTVAEVTRKLRRAIFEFDRMAKGSHEIGDTSSGESASRFRGTPGICQKERCVQSCVRPDSR